MWQNQGCVAAIEYKQQILPLIVKTSFFDKINEVATTEIVHIIPYKSYLVKN